MKKLLLATTMLVMAGTYAAADVSISGDGRMGVVSNDGTTSFSSRMRVKFSGSGTTDGGLSFGGSFRAADATGAKDGTKGSVYISGAFGKLTMGDTGNAVDSLVSNVSAVGYGASALDGAQELGLLDNADKTAVSYNVSISGATVEIGSGQVDGDNEYYSAAVAYTFGGVSAAIGYESNVDDSQTKASISANVGPATVKVAVADRDSADDIGYAISTDFTMAGATVTAYYANDNADEANMAVGVGYDLGGGAVFKAGVGSIYDGVESVTVADAGVSFSF
mgnify:CR=1 FL=1|jgi:outer membrane protein OmpU